MQRGMPLTFKIATEKAEFEQVHHLNYETFVEEIPQHARNPAGMLVDKFHEENTYLICLDGGQLVGMVAMRGQRPFSLDAKLPNLDAYLPPGRNLCEIRLLSIRPNKRMGRVLLGLLKLISEYGRRNNFNLAVISGTTRQLKMYANIGFVPFGPAVGTAEAQYQPMYITLEDFNHNVGQLIKSGSSTAVKALFPETFLPGPVAISREVRRALSSPAVSHRSASFVEQMQEMKRQLCRLVNARFGEIMLGTGTLGNDVVAWQLTRLGAPGLILTNGEFGERLTDHATRARLQFDTLPLPWGAVFDRDGIERALNRVPRAQWLWAAHCETSTGVINDLPMLQAVCDQRGAHLCLDCCSSVGTLPMDLSGVYLAASVSGKGLGSFPGLALVFYNHPVMPEPTRIPRYLDLGLYATQDGIPFTHSSNLHSALRAAIKRFAQGLPYEEMAALGAWLRARLRALGFMLLAPEGHASPVIVTIVLPPDIAAMKVGEELEAEGFLLSYRSTYLRARNWIQISLMGECSQNRLLPLLDALQRYAPAREAAPAAAPAAVLAPAPAS